MRILTTALALALTVSTAAMVDANTPASANDPAVANACYAVVGNTHFNHIDSAVSAGSWGLCTYSDRVDRIGPGSEPVAEALFYKVGNAWAYTRRHTSGHYDLAALTFYHVPYAVAQQLIAKRALALSAVAGR